MWRVFGFDTFSNERYPIQPQSNFIDEAQAREAVRATLLEIEHTQPSSESGDSDEEGSIQDCVILVDSSGTEEFFNVNHLRS